MHCSVLIIISLFSLVGCDPQTKQSNNTGKSNLVAEVFADEKDGNIVSNYPKRFEIIENNGERLEIRVYQLANKKKEYFIKVEIDDLDQNMAKKVVVPEIFTYQITRAEGLNKRAMICNLFLL